MKTYKATFTGREVNAIGIFYPITTTVQGANEEQARINLYDRYDHIMGLVLTEQEASGKCGKCGAYNLNDLGHGKGTGTIICLSCGAKWWQKWYTDREWELWINDVTEA